MGCYGNSMVDFQVLDFQVLLLSFISECAVTWCSSIEIIPCVTIAVALTTEVQPIEVRVMTVVVPPGTSVHYSTVTTPPVMSLS